MGEQICQTWWSIRRSGMCEYQILHPEGRKLNPWTMEWSPTEIFGHEKICSSTAYNVWVFIHLWAGVFINELYKIDHKKFLGSDLSESCVLLKTTSYINDMANKFQQQVSH